MKKSELYKVFQLFNFFVNEYSYTSFGMMGSMSKEGELWLAKKDDPNYQLIRITNESNEVMVDERNKIETIKDVCMQKMYLKEIKFLDIHICNDEVYGHEYYDTACIEIGFRSGIDLSQIYPGVYEVLHETKDEESEIKGLIDSINKKINELKIRDKNRPFLYQLKNSPLTITYVFMAVCMIMSLALLRYTQTYSQSASLIYLGADYKMFTLGLGQFWRLFTYAFLHSSMVHIITNMFSLFVLGTLLEPRIGHLKYVSILICGILGASLTHGVLSGNSLVVGLSGGIYAVFAYFILYYLERKLLDIRSLIPTIFLNVGLNFLPNISWQAHLGGAVIGILFYYIYKNDKVDWKIAPVILLLLGGMFFKYVRDFYVKPYYGATDMEVVQIIRDDGRQKSADRIEKKLYEIYTSDK